MFHRLRSWWWRRKYVAGSTHWAFIAPDIRREVEIVDASEVESGFVVARVRTRNANYEAHGVAPEPAFSEPRRISISDMWQWTGLPWGGPVRQDEP